MSNKQIIKAKAFNKVWSHIININAKQDSWDNSAHAIIDSDQIKNVSEWYNKELEVYNYLMELIKKDTHENRRSEII